MKIELTNITQNKNLDDPNKGVSWIDFVLSGVTTFHENLEVTVLENPKEDIVVRFEKCQGDNFVWVSAPSPYEVILSDDLIGDENVIYTHETFEKQQAWIAKLQSICNCDVFKNGKGVLVFNLS